MDQTMNIQILEHKNQMKLLEKDTNRTAKQDGYSGWSTDTELEIPYKRATCKYFHQYI